MSFILKTSTFYSYLKKKIEFYHSLDIFYAHILFTIIENRIETRTTKQKTIVVIKRYRAK